jgi:hypothetical protein
MATAGRAGKRRALRESRIERLCAGDAVFMFRVESALFGANNWGLPRRDHARRVHGHYRSTAVDACAGTRRAVPRQATI